MRSSLRPSRFISLVVILIALLLLQQVLVAETTSSVLLGSAVLVTGFIAGVRLWFRNSFEGQVVVFLVAALTAVGTLLAVTVGPPGSDPTELTLIPVALLLLPVVIFVLQAVDYRQYEDRRNARRRPYASGS